MEGEMILGDEPSLRPPVEAQQVPYRFIPPHWYDLWTWDGEKVVGDWDEARGAVDLLYRGTHRYAEFMVHAPLAAITFDAKAVECLSIGTGKICLRMIHGYLRACFVSKAEQDQAICTRYGIQQQDSRKDGSSQKPNPQQARG
jgi:hypothetical protein